jgi:uncharacterized membrane protein
VQFGKYHMRNHTFVAGIVPNKIEFHRNKGPRILPTANEHRLLIEIQVFCFPFIKTFAIFILVFAGIGLSCYVAKVRLLTC